MTKAKPKIIYVCCSECGLAANMLTCLVKFSHMPKQFAFEVSTWGEGVCDCCGRLTNVTEARDFFYPDFTLLSSKFLKSLK